MATAWAGVVLVSFHLLCLCTTTHCFLATGFTGALQYEDWRSAAKSFQVMATTATQTIIAAETGVYFYQWNNGTLFDSMTMVQFPDLWYDDTEGANNPSPQASSCLDDQEHYLYSCDVNRVYRISFDGTYKLLVSWNNSDSNPSVSLWLGCMPSSGGKNTQSNTIVVIRGDQVLRIIDHLDSNETEVTYSADLSSCGDLVAGALVQNNTKLIRLDAPTSWNLQCAGAAFSMNVTLYDLQSDVISIEQKVLLEDLSPVSAACVVPVLLDDAHVGIVAGFGDMGDPPSVATIVFNCQNLSDYQIHSISSLRGEYSSFRCASWPSPNESSLSSFVIFTDTSAAMIDSRNLTLIKEALLDYNASVLIAGYGAPNLMHVASLDFENVYVQLLEWDDDGVLTETHRMRISSFEDSFSISEVISYGGDLAWVTGASNEVVQLDLSGPAVSRYLALNVSGADTGFFRTAFGLVLAIAYPDGSLAAVYIDEQVLNQVKLVKIKCRNDTESVDLLLYYDQQPDSLYLACANFQTSELAIYRAALADGSLFNGSMVIENQFLSNFELPLLPSKQLLYLTTDSFFLVDALSLQPVRVTPQTFPDGYFSFITALPTPSRASVFYTSITADGDDGYTQYLEIDTISLSVIQAMNFSVVNFTGVSYHTSCVPSLGPESNDSFHAICENGILTVSLDGVILDWATVPADTNFGGLQSAIYGSGGAILLLTSDTWFLVYENCPVDKYRLLTGECVSCPTDSLSSPHEQQFCVPCPSRTQAAQTRCVCAETFYSAANDTNCNPCPTGAVCPGENLIEAASGYWRGANETFYLCPFASACTATGCTVGYRGPVCGTCDDHYGRTAAGCGVCPRKPWHYSVPVMLCCAIVLALILLLLWKDTHGETEQFFGVVKTFMSFIQVLSFPTGRLPLFGGTPIAKYYSKLVSIVNAVGLRVFSVASLDCLFGKHVPIYYVELVAVGFVPIALSIAIILLTRVFRSPLKSAQRPSSHSKGRHQRFGSTHSPVGEELYPSNDFEQTTESRSQQSDDADATTPLMIDTDQPIEREEFVEVRDTTLGAPIRLALFIFLLVYPYASSLLAQFFQCQQIDGVAYLVADYSSRCFDSQWRRMLAAEAVLLLAYPVGGVLAILLLLRSKRHELNLRFMTAQYKPQYYYWDVVEMLRKLLLLLAIIWDQYRQQTDVEWFSGLPLVLAMLGMLLTSIVRPHRRDDQFYLQIASLLGLCLLYSLPIISPTAKSNLYRLIASWVVLVYVAGFSLLSGLYALYQARDSSVFRLCRRFRSRQ